MKFLRLIVKNILRNRRRTLLTVASIAVSLFLVATLRSLLTELQNPPSTPDSALRLITRHKVSLFNSLPISYRQKISRVEGVEAVFGSMWFGGIYKDPSNFFPNFSVDVDQFFQVSADMKIPEDQKVAFQKDRIGAVVGNNLARRLGWKIGDRIHLKGTLFQMDPELTIRGIYSGGSDEGSGLYFHWEYFYEGMRKLGMNEGAAFTGTFTIRARSVEEVPKVAERIDALFQNSGTPTKTETEKAFVLSFLSVLGNVQLFITGICSVVTFTVILVAANTMAMSIRERWREIGVLKTLGFQNSQVLFLLIGESLLLALTGAFLGTFGAKYLFASIDMAQVTAGFFQRLTINAETIALCLGLGLLVGLLAAGFPAWRASQRPAVEAIRRVN
jgi:putative ABC transport system permease protein